MKIELIETIQVSNILGEGVVWNERTNTIWWTDIESRLLYSYDPYRKTLKKYETPERVGCFAFTEEEGWLLIAFENGIAYFNPEQNSIKWLNRFLENSSYIRLNDGRVDRQGRFWVGSLVEDEKKTKEQGKLYRIDQNGDETALIDNVLISNSLCWSPNGTKMYFADSPSRQIVAYDFDIDTGTISNPKIFAETPEGIVPDGSVVDSEGFLWNAQWGGSRVVRYTNDGAVDHILEMPVSQPTCVAFGGPDLTWMFVTSASVDLTDDQLTDQPEAGYLFIYKTDVTGIAEKEVVKKTSF